MQDFKEDKKGRVSIGISPFRASYFLSETIKKLQGKYPGLQIVLKEAASDELKTLVLEGGVDFAIINLPIDDILFDVIGLVEEPLALVIPKNLEKKILKKSPKIGLKECKNLPFISLSKNQELRKLFDKLCGVSGFTPNITVEVVGITTAWSLAQAGIGATILPLRFIEEHQTENKVSVYELSDNACIRKPAIVLRKGQYLSKYARKVIEKIIEN